MSNTAKRLKGKLEELGGAAKAGLGKALGNERMEASGKATELKGKARQAAAKAGERLKGTAEVVKGAVKGSVGKVIGNEQMELEGKAEKLKGKARKSLNQ